MAVAQGALDRLDEMRRRQEPELVWVADVQVAHPRACLLHLARLGDDVANGVGEAIDALGSANRGSGDGHSRDLTCIGVGRAGGAGESLWWCFDRRDHLPVRPAVSVLSY